MQLYVTSPNPEDCVKVLDDVRLRAACKEAGQLFSTGYTALQGPLDDLYKPFAPHHPVVKWTCANLGNLEWVREYLEAAANEYLYRRGLEHGTWEKLKFVAWRPINVETIPDKEEEFVNCASRKSLGLDYTHYRVYDGYKFYLEARWRMDEKPPQWTKRTEPEWRVD